MVKMKWFESGALIVMMMWIIIESASGSAAAAATTLTLSLTSLHPQPCTPSSQGPTRSGPSLEVRHKYGPCSPFKSQPTFKEISDYDDARVESLRNRIYPKNTVHTIDKNEITLPAQSGRSIGTGNYVITLGLGTPRTDLTLIFDTGSDFTWTQCEPCVGDNCYEQKEPKFDPSKSSTYANITCNSVCNDIQSVAQFVMDCTTSSSNCIYKIGYGDQSFSEGFVSSDTFYLGPGSQHPVTNYLFGCGKMSQGNFGGAAGLIGLSTSKLSLVAQSAFDYFSYCLPPDPSSTGYLTFGKAQPTAKTGTQYIPLLKTSPTGVDSNLYFVELEGIQVEGKDLAISSTVFTTAGTIIDSGTVITRLPTDAYTALKEAFTEGMSSYPKVPPAEGDLLDTCFDFTGHDNVTFPSISLVFGGGVQMDLPSGGILIPVEGYQYCLAFAKSSDVGILGNTQQLSFDIVYDIAGAKLGFAYAPNGCT